MRTIIDLRSDGVSRPSEAMLKAMLNASVGDDVLGDDPSVEELQEYAAALFNRQAGLFCPSGVMANQVALLLLAGKDNAYLCNEFTHTYYFESGGPATMNGIEPVLCRHVDGILDLADVEWQLQKEKKVTAAVIENTVNKGGGVIYPTEYLKKLCQVLKNHGLKIHLDGARIFNALTVTGDSPAVIGQLTDTLSFCLSKGLGAPVGSILLGDKNMIAEARKIRNKLGGAMRQAGYLAAAGLFALKNNISRLAEDHYHAQILVNALKENPLIKEVKDAPTNIIIARTETNVERDYLLEYFRSRQLLAVAFGDCTLRMVTHLNITKEMTLEAARIIRSAGCRGFVQAGM